MRREAREQGAVLQSVPSPEELLERVEVQRLLGTFTPVALDARTFTNRGVTILGREAQTVDLVLDGGGEVRGTVVDEAGTHLLPALRG